MDTATDETTTTESTTDSSSTTTTRQRPSRPGKSSDGSTTEGETPADMGEMCDPETDEDCEAPADMGEMCDPESDEDCEMPSDMSEGLVKGGDFNGKMTMQGPTSSDSILHPVGYLALGGGSVILSMVIVYACFSKFFHKKPGETFNQKKKFVWYCVASVALAAVFITLCYFIPVWTRG